MAAIPDGSRARNCRFVGVDTAGWLGAQRKLLLRRPRRRAPGPPRFRDSTDRGLRIHFRKAGEASRGGRVEQGHDSLVPSGASNDPSRRLSSERILADVAQPNRRKGSINCRSLAGRISFAARRRYRPRIPTGEHPRRCGWKRCLLARPGLEVAVASHRFRRCLALVDPLRRQFHEANSSMTRPHSFAGNSSSARVICIASKVSILFSLSPSSEPTRI
jgi:hypothetical protein